MRSDPSTLEAALLGLLARGPASGYELRKIFLTTPLAAYSDSPGAVYPALRRLEQRGYVSGRAEPGARRRKPWQLTAAGRSWLRSWVAQPVTAATLAEARRWADDAVAALAPLPDGPVKKSLSRFAQAIVERSG